MSPAGADALQALSETLEPSPLQEALAKMAARHRRNRGAKKMARVRRFRVCLRLIFPASPLQTSPLANAVCVS